jgi:YHS domain-containing protein
MRSRNIALAVLALCAVSLMASADEARKPGIYPLATCPVSGEKLNAKGDPIVRQIDGREIRFCCEGCVAKFEADKETFLKKIDAEIIAQQKDSYPTEKCIDMPEDDIDPKLDYVFDNRLVRVCCRDCVKEIQAESAKYLAVLDKAVVDKQKPAYPLTTCVVSGEPLDGSHGEPVEYVLGTRLVRLCCKGCVAKFEKDPHGYLAKIDDAGSKSASTDKS